MTPAKHKTTVGVIFGGRSAEHEVSLVSATSVINALDKRKYDIIPIGITPGGRWVSAPDVLDLLKAGSGWESLPEAVLVPNPAHTGLLFLSERAAGRTSRPIDVLFPVLHGPFGEDGTVQGLFELAGIPYVGAGVLGSSVGMDKVLTKQLCEHEKIPIVPYVSFLEEDVRGTRMLPMIERKLGYPCFVKPANMGSSIGISKVRTRRELRAGITTAGLYDRKILVEKSIEHAREIEVSVLGNDRPEASVPGEIIPSNEFYDYDAKYVDGQSRAIIPAELPARVKQRLMELAVRCFRAVECAGMARVDFLVTKDHNRIYMNEINTIPGFTSISMYPKLWDASGLEYRKLLDRLIQLALQRHRQMQQRQTVFTPKAAWYRT